MAEPQASPSKGFLPNFKSPGDQLLGRSPAPSTKGSVYGDVPESEKAVAAPYEFTEENEALFKRVVSVMGDQPKARWKQKQPNTITSLPPSNKSQGSGFTLILIGIVDDNTSLGSTLERWADGGSSPGAPWLVQKLYMGHAFITFVSVTDAVRKAGIMELPGYLDVMDELNFAFFIGKASESLSNIFSTVGKDMTHLMEAIQFQEKFFQKLCPPLTIKSLILVAQLIVGNLEEIKAFRPLKFIAGIPGTIAKAPVLIGKLKGLPGFVKGKLGKKSALPPNTVKALTAREGAKTGVFWKV